MSSVLTHVRSVESSWAATWTPAFANPVGGDLLLITFHARQEIMPTSVTFGGVTAELIASAFWANPSVHVYGIRKANQPTEGQTHDLVVTWDEATTGMVTLTKLDDVSPSVQDGVLSSLTTAVVDNSNVSANITTSVAAVVDSFLFAALSLRDGCPAELTSEGEVLTSQCFDPPRGGSVALVSGISAGTHSVSWSWGSVHLRRHIVVVIPHTPSVGVSEEPFQLRHNPRTNKVIPVLSSPTVTDIGANCVRPRVSKGY